MSLRDSVLSLFRHCEGHASGPWQSLFSFPTVLSLRGLAEAEAISFLGSQCVLDNGDCHVGTKPVPPRNDVWGDVRAFGNRYCEALPLPRHCEPAQAGVAISLWGLPTVLSLRGACLVAPWQSLFLGSQYTLGTEIAISGAKTVPSRNDGWGEGGLREPLLRGSFFPSLVIARP